MLGRLKTGVRAPVCKHLRVPLDQRMERVRNRVRNFFPYIAYDTGEADVVLSQISSRFSHLFSSLSEADGADE